MFFASSRTSENFRPIKRLAEKTVLRGLVTACRLAACPTRRSPVLVNATTDGVVRPPSALGTTTGSPPSMTAMQEFVVPRSIPRMRLMRAYSATHVPRRRGSALVPVIQQLKTYSQVDDVRREAQIHATLAHSWHTRPAATWRRVTVEFQRRPTNFPA